MNYYVIGIGGTGAKCIESLIHLTATGMLPPGKLFAMFVDPDKSNGSLARAQVTLQEYNRCKEISFGSVDLFKTELVQPKPDFWSPFIEANPQLDNFFGYDVLKQSNPAVGSLFDVLYSESERTTNLNMGFRGHPSIGSVVLSQSVDLGNNDPWLTFRNLISDDIKGAGTGAKVFLFGSIFGGTGASGFPTIGRLIRQAADKIGALEIGGALILPYFSFNPPPDGLLKASSDDFMVTTQVALKYYQQNKKTDIYNAIYLVGDESRVPVDYSIGGNTQENEPHFIELLSALAALDFFRNVRPSGYKMIARDKESFLSWSDLDDGNKGNTLKDKIAAFTRFAYAYLSVYRRKLNEIIAQGKGFNAPFYVDFFQREKVAIPSEEEDQIKKYCESFLLWLACIQQSAIGNISGDLDANLKLVRHNAFSQKDGKMKLKQPNEFDAKSFGNLILPTERVDPSAINRLWKYMSSAKVSDPNAVGIGKFYHALYLGCK
jgi:hypothetical protein